MAETTKIEWPRCRICGWPLALRREDGCVAGDCSYRPHEGTEEYRRIQRRREMLAADDAEREAVWNEGLIRCDDPHPTQPGPHSTEGA